MLFPALTSALSCPRQGALRCKLADIKAERDCAASDAAALRRQLAGKAGDASLPLFVAATTRGAPRVRPASVQGLADRPAQEQLPLSRSSS